MYSRRQRRKIINSDAFKWSFTGAATPVLIFMVLAVVGVLSSWITTVATTGGVGASGITCFAIWEEYTGYY